MRQPFDLVTGGCGFVGSNLVEKLVDMGHRVKVFDLHESRQTPQGAEFFKGDMRDYDSVGEALEGVETIYHLAFIQVFSQKTEGEKWEINFGGTENFLRASTEAKVRRFVHTSTVEVYSPYPPFRAPEDAPTDHPFGWYGRHKKACEELCWKYHDVNGLQVVILRLPTICGPGYYARVDLLRAFDWLLLNRPLFWFSGPPVKGDFVWIDDCIQGFILGGTVEGASGETFNISCSEPSDAIEIIKKLKEVSGNNRRIVRVPSFLVKPLIKLATKTPLLKMPAEQIEYLFCDNSYSIEKASKLLEYSPQKNAADAAGELLKGYMKERKEVKDKAKVY